MSQGKDMKVLARDKKTLAEDSLLPLHCGSASNCRAESRADYPPHSRVQHPTVAYFKPKNTLTGFSSSPQRHIPRIHCHCIQWYFLILLHLSYTRIVTLVTLPLHEKHGNDPLPLMARDD